MQTGTRGGKERKMQRNGAATQAVLVCVGPLRGHTALSYPRRTVLVGQKRGKLLLPSAFPSLVTLVLTLYLGKDRPPAAFVASPP